MLENILNSVKSEVGADIQGQTNLPPDKLDSVFSVVGEVAHKEVAGQMLGGNLSSVMNLFSNKPNDQSADSLQNNITTGTISSLTSKLGLSGDVAKKIAAMVIPSLLKTITKKNSETPDDDPSPLHEIFGGEGGIGGSIKNILGKVF